MKKLLLSTVLSLTFSFMVGQTKPTNADYRQMSLNYVSSKLRSPGSASLVYYDDPKEAKDLLTSVGFTIPECTKVTRVIVDSQNGFGALIRSFLFVFFKDGKPCHMESADDMKDPALLSVVLSVNRCDCGK